MLSLAKRDANKSNAQKSTGPRSCDGIDRSSRNALRHGLTAVSTVVIDGIEDPADYETLLAAVLEDLDAQGPVEMLLAERVGQLFWRLRRVVRFETERLGQAQGEILPTTSDLGDAFHEQDRRRAMLASLGHLFQPPDDELGDATAVMIVNACLEVMSSEQRTVFLNGQTAEHAASPEDCRTVAGLLAFIRAGEVRLKEANIVVVGTGNTASIAYQYLAGLDRQWRRMDAAVSRGLARQRTEALLLEIERASIVDRYEPRLRRDLSQTLKDLHDRQDRRIRCALAGSNLALAE